MVSKYNLPPGFILKGNKYQYRIEKILGQGSFGITYLAKLILEGELGQLSTEVPVAVKEFFMRDFNSRESTGEISGVNNELYIKYRKDFRREANNLSCLKHPGIVKVLESFEENNTSYYSMEYIEGQNLNSFIEKKGRLSANEACHNILEILDALSFMHGNHILHLDLKPLNIMRRSNGGFVLIDFGLSKQFGNDGTVETSTLIGAGTPGYAPLEQWTYNKSEGFAPTLDIYAIGGILYKMLTGITPPDAMNIFNNGFPETSLLQLGISQQLIDIIEKAMSPQKSKRYQSLTEIITAIKELPTVPHSGSNIDIETGVVDTEPSVEIAEPTREFEICNGFHVKWKDTVSDKKKETIRGLLKGMISLRHHNPNLIFNGVDEERKIGGFSMSLYDRTMWDLKKLDLINSERTSVSEAINAINKLSEMTGIPFRFAKDSEQQATISGIGGKPWRQLFISEKNDLKYRWADFGGVDDKNIYDITNFFDREYRFQIVTDFQKPIHDIHAFNVPWTSYIYSKIEYIGFNLFKVRRENRWNVTSPLHPMAKWLSEDFDEISTITIHHIPGPGPGYRFFGLWAEKNGRTYFFDFKNNTFKLICSMSDQELRRASSLT